MPMVQITNTNENKVDINISFSDVKKEIENMSALPDGEIEEILNKINELEKIVKSSERKSKKWENAKGIVKWIADKGVDVGIAKGFREAGQTAANAFRTFADKPEMDYSKKEQKHPITKAVLAPMKAVKKMLVSMELHLDASIDKLDNLAMNVKLDKEKHIENTKAQKQTEPERAEAERVEAEIVYSPMVTEPQEYQYNADAFEARGVDEVKQEAAHKEAPKVREDKAR